MQAFDQLQGLFIRAEQNVMPVVEQPSFQSDGSRPTTQGAARFKQRDHDACFSQCQCGGATRPAAADDGDAGCVESRFHGNNQVLLASHSLRRGVSDTRARRTGKWSRWISSSKVR